MLLSVIGFSGYSQEKRPGSKVKPEIKAGVTFPDYQNQVMPSIQLAFLFADGKYINVGPFINGSISVQAASKPASFQEDYEYQPMGFRGGINFRVSTNSERTHGFIDIVPSVGRAMQTGVVTNISYDKAWEYSACINLGVNFKLKSGDYFGIYMGGGKGFFNYKEISRREDFNVIQAGFTYQSSF